MADVIFFFLLPLCFLPLISAASPPSLPPSAQQLTPPPSPTPITPQFKPSPPQQSPLIQSPPPLSMPQQPPVIQYPPPTPSRTEAAQERMKNILEALIGSGDFANWGNLLTTADPSLLPFTSTLFVPNNDVVMSSFPSSGVGGDVSIDPFLFLYHIVPHRLTFADLCLFTAPNTRLPTLLPTKSILITNASRVNFTIDGARVTDPDLYWTDSVTIHGIGGLLDYQVYGGDGSVASFPWMNQSQSQNQGVGGLVPKLVESSKGGILRSGFAAVFSMSMGLMMM